MIICEGPDGGGKTTLAERLCEDLDYEYRRPPSNVLSSSEGPIDPKGLAEWWVGEVEAIEQRQRIRVVYDRCAYISDPIYRLLFGDPSGSTPEEMARGIWCVTRYSHLVFCLPGGWVAQEAVDQYHRPGLAVTKPFSVLYWAYQCQAELWRQSMGFYCHFYDRTNYDELLEAVARWR